MQHRAFLFDFDAFQNTLRATLEAALRSGSTDALLHFIENAQDELKEPYEGESLPADWHDLFDPRDPHQLGDIALTKFYDPKQDRGLGQDWEAAASTLEPVAAELGFSPVLGHFVGPKNNPFDPGKMGAYFLSQRDVERASRAISEVSSVGHIGALARLLEDAKSAGLGLYITF